MISFPRAPRSRLNVLLVTVYWLSRLQSDRTRISSSFRPSTVILPVGYLEPLSSLSHERTHSSLHS